MRFIYIFLIASVFPMSITRADRGQACPESITHQPRSQYYQIWKDTKTTIEALTFKHHPQKADYRTLYAFLASKQAQEWRDRVQALSLYERTQLYNNIANMPGGDFTWIPRRNFLACLVQTGVDVNIIMDSGNNFLGQSVIHDDQQGIDFAMQHHATFVDVGPVLNPLGCVRSAAAARAILSLPQFAHVDTRMQHSALTIACSNRHDPEIFDIFKEHGFDFNISNVQKYTLLHTLASDALYEIDSSAWRRKLDVCKQAGLDPFARDIRGMTPLDMINQKLTHYPQHATLLTAQRLLQDWQKEVPQNSAPCCIVM